MPVVTDLIDLLDFKARERTNNKLNPHMVSTSGLKPRPHYWEAITLFSQLHHPLLPLLILTFVLIFLALSAYKRVLRVSSNEPLAGLA